MMNDAEFSQPAGASKEVTTDGSPGSNKSSSSRKAQDEEFIAKTATTFGGVIRIAPGLWKSVYRLSSRGVEFCPQHEGNLWPLLSPGHLAGIKSLYQVTLSFLPILVFLWFPTLLLTHHNEFLPFFCGL
jgi:hypothetical protein